jgi:hypothetical protein
MTEKNEQSEWQRGRLTGELAARLLLVGDDVALQWAKTEEQVAYVAKVFNHPEMWVRQVMRNRELWKPWI